MTNLSLNAPLAGLKVIEISFLESVAYAGALLAQLGASVVKIEPPAGDPLRRRPPFGSDEVGDEHSIPFEFFNAGKSSIIYDPLKPTAAVRNLISACDVLVVDHQTLQSMHLRLSDRAPRQLRVFVGLYGGSEGCSVTSSALSRLHASTSGYIIPADLDTTKRPAWPGPYVFECVHGVGLAVATVAERNRPEGGDVDYSLQAYGLWLDKLLFSRTSTSGVEIHRHTAPYPYGGNMACTDGYVSILVLEEHQWRGFARMIQKPQWLVDERFRDGVSRNRNRAPLAEALKEWCFRRTVDEVLSAAREYDVPAGRCRSPLQVLHAEIGRARQFFAYRDTAFGRIQATTLPYGPHFRGVAVRQSPPLGKS